MSTYSQIQEILEEHPNLVNRLDEAGFSTDAKWSILSNLQFIKIKKGFDVDSIEGLMRAKNWLVSAPNSDMFYGDGDGSDNESFIESFVGPARRMMLIESVGSAVGVMADMLCGQFDDEDVVFGYSSPTIEDENEMIDLQFMSDKLIAVEAEHDENGTVTGYVFYNTSEDVCSISVGIDLHDGDTFVDEGGGKFAICRDGKILHPEIIPRLWVADSNS